MSFTDACALLVQGVTAHTLSRSAYPLCPGRWCLIQAIAGGVGLPLMQEEGMMEREHQPGSLLAQLAQTYTALMGAFAYQVGMSPTRLEILRELLHEPELGQATLQKRLQIDAAALTRHVQQLEREGLIQRRINPQHHRLLLLTLTEVGR